jgi:predicted DCC family thiol-disulfide oxidoreductase YuxK
MATMERAVLLYDEDCGFCRWAAERILAFDRRGAVRAAAIQSDAATTLLSQIDPALRLSSWHLVTPSGRVYSAGAAIAPLARLLPFGRPVAAVAAAFPGATERLYRLLARNRDRLGALLGTSACAVDPSARR